MRTPTMIAALALVAMTANAQQSSKWPFSAPWPPRPPMAPRMIVPQRPQEPGKPMELREMDVRARIAGLQVETTTTMTFFNPNFRQLEGELQFPLPDGATVTGYALDINGQMVDGVVVKREKARVAFETEVRRGIDPGIVEHVAGNVYRTRIYPLPAQGVRKVRLSYVAELSSDKTGDAACFLPMPIGESVARLTIRIEASPVGVKPEIGGFGNLRFRSFDNLWVAETEVRDAQPGEDIWVALPRLPAQIATVERTADGDVYFAASDLYVAATTSAKAPRKLGIAWDASGSRAGRHLQEEIAALRKLGLNSSVLIFRDRPEDIRPLGDPDALKDIAYDGGTDLAAAAAKVRQSDIHDWLLFTDGFDTLGEELPDFGDKNVTAIVSQTVADRELLRQVCARVIDLQRFDASAIFQPPVRLVRVHGTGIAEVQGIGGAAQGRVGVHGKLTADEAELRFEYSDGRRSPLFKLSRRAATGGELLAGVWAAQRVNQLAVRAEANEDELLALGRRFGIVSPATSLIVLERLDQYVRHDIEPPASLPDLRRQWHDRLASLAKNEQQQRAGKIDRVLAMWRERVAWWETSHRVPADFGRPEEMTSANRVHSGWGAQGGVEGGAVEEAPPALPRGVSGGVPGGVVAGVPGGTVGQPVATLDGAPGDLQARKSAEHGSLSPGAATQAALQTVAEKFKDARPGGARITVQAWDPATPYLRALKAAAKADRYKVYLEQRSRFAASPAFFVDCAEFFLREGDNAVGVRVLTNLAELQLEEPALLRVLAWRLQQAGDLDRAIAILRKVARLRPEEPQSYRDLALALAEHGETAEATTLLAKVVMGEWDNRFPEIEVVALEELNALIARTHPPGPPPVDQRLIKNLDVDVRIVMSWDADATDVDLHVVEPSGEEAAYNHNRTTIGGLVSHDLTQGYGPEEYMVRRGMPGPFKIFARYYGSRQQTLVGPCTITATVFTDFGRPTQKKQVLTLRLDQPQQEAGIGEVWIGGPGKSFPSKRVGTGGDTPPALGREAFRAIRVDQRGEDVKRLLGEPRQKRHGEWIYRVGDRRYRLRFSDAEQVQSVTELLPGGAEMILVQ